MDRFAEQLLNWFDVHGRKSLPWQIERSPYRTWVSEIMLQQTQVATVIPYFDRFTRRFPDIPALAAADIDQVLNAWTGLGYYARGRNLHKAAQHMVEHHNGELPRDLDLLTGLPGIGRSTAGAILASAFEIRAPILDGNVKRVLARYHAVQGWPGTTATARALWAHADDHTPAERIRDYTQAVMDLGALVCTRGAPACENCPLRDDCSAKATGTIDQFPGRKPRKTLAVREVRAFVLTDSAQRTLLERRPLDGLWGGLWTPPERPRQTTLDSILAELGLPRGDVKQARTLPPFRHTFTHFHMDIEPVHATLTTSAKRVADGDHRRWWHAEEVADIGLSSAAIKLLDLCGEPAQGA